MPISFFRLNITAKSDERYLVFRREEADYCCLDCQQWSVIDDWCKAHKDPRRTRRSRFSGTMVRQASRSSVIWLPYEVMRPRIVRRLGELLTSRMYDTCYRFDADSLPVTPASMAKDYLGCSLSALAEKFEHQFEDGMTWGNFGAGGWVIDHILPVSQFDFRKITHVRRACHYRNLRPCWETENIRKGNRLMPC